MLFRSFLYTDPVTETIANGSTVVVAAGNDAGNVSGYSPGNCAGVITVGATRITGGIAYYSNFGAQVDVTAPGGNQQLGTTSGVLSTINSGQRTPESAAYGWMQGTSMACPHVSGVAALGLSYALAKGRHYTVDEFKSMLLTAVNDIDSYIIGGTKNGMVLRNYRKNMGTGSIDAYQLLMQIEGTPCLKVGVGAEELVPLTQFFGGSATNLTYTGVSMSAADMAKLGIETLPTMAYGKLKIKCTKSGVAKITVTAIGGGNKVGTGTVMGGMTITKEFAIIARGVQAGNGGWL